MENHQKWCPKLSSKWDPETGRSVSGRSWGTFGAAAFFNTKKWRQSASKTTPRIQIYSKNVSKGSKWKPTSIPKEEPWLQNASKLPKILGSNFQHKSSIKLQLSTIARRTARSAFSNDNNCTYINKHIAFLCTFLLNAMGSAAWAKPLNNKWKKQKKWCGVVPVLTTCQHRPAVWATMQSRERRQRQNNQMLAQLPNQLLGAYL